MAKGWSSNAKRTLGPSGLVSSAICMEPSCIKAHVPVSLWRRVASLKRQSDGRPENQFSSWTLRDLLSFQISQRRNNDTVLVFCSRCETQRPEDGADTPGSGSPRRAISQADSKCRAAGRESRDQGSGVRDYVKKNAADLQRADNE